MIRIVAEAGVNHDGSVEKALDLVEAAKNAGADVVKFQIYRPEEFMRRTDSNWDLLSRLALPFESFRKIASHCEALGIEFMGTPDGCGSLRFLVEELPVKRIKIGSGQLTNRRLLGLAFETDLPVILSTGMATFDEVREVVEAAPWVDLTLLHCTSLYPCPLRLANVSAMYELGKLGKKVGYSDHTIGSLAAILAVAYGATVIEKHFSLGGTISPDHAMSAGPESFGGLVAAVREAEAAMGDGTKVLSAEELEAARALRVGSDGLRGAA
jgi:N-acetylneuraminate synthase/N,N'-diacetyllegionaminate synthase